ncbi:MAG: hypothetical protein KatS3mg087_1630 [Patescibacteria group bacterium]|nr:MAG: hypothetical protein KatS3mg087_1630 [Patescibacteria group bacterium]
MTNLNWWKSIEKPYPTNPIENIKYRIKLLGKLNSSQKSVVATAKLIKSDPEAFFDLFLWTYNPREQTKDIPFILYPFQRKTVQIVNQHIDDQKDLLIEKSRDMGVSWLVAGLFLWRWLTKDESFLIGSEKEEKVDSKGNIVSLFEKIRYLIRHMPPQFKPDYDTAHMKIVNKETNAIIQGEAANPDFGRAGRYNAVFLDEFAHIDLKLGEAMWQACSQSAPCRITASSVKGYNNKFGQLRKEGRISVHIIDWREHPLKDEAWYQKQKEFMSAIEIAQEIDRNYLASAGKPFYQGFDEIRNVVESYTPIMGKPILVGIDYGFHHPAFVLAQIDTRDRLTVFDEFLGSDLTTKNFAEKLKMHLSLYYKGHKFMFFADPAGEQRTDKSEQSSKEIMEEVLGAMIYSKQSNYRFRKEIIENRLTKIIDDKAALCVVKYCRIMIEAFKGGYRYPEPDKHGIVPEAPFKDGYYDHIMNAFEYIIINMFDTIDDAVDISFGNDILKPPKVVPLSI